MRRRLSSQDILFQQAHKFIHTQTCLPDDGSQCASNQHFVVRHNHLSKGFIASQDQMAAPVFASDRNLPAQAPEHTCALKSRVTCSYGYRQKLKSLLGNRQAILL